MEPMLHTTRPLSGQILNSADLYVSADVMLLLVFAVLSDSAAHASSELHDSKSSRGTSRVYIYEADAHLLLASQVASLASD